MTNKYLEVLNAKNNYRRELVDLSSIGGGGASLPEVTSEDNGDVLTVVDGQWDKAAHSGGTSTTLVYFEGTLDNNNYSIVPTTNWNYTSGEVVDMIFNQKSPVAFGVYLTDLTDKKLFYNMTPVWFISNVSVSCKFIDDVPNQDHYRILEDGTVELDE